MLSDLQAWRLRWSKADFRTIPLGPYGKAPAVAGESWKDSPAGQWGIVEGQAQGMNLGVILERGRAVIDCDSVECAQVVRGQLKARSKKIIEVKTPSGGSHFYIRVTDAPEGFNWGLLAIGAGELRVNNCYVAAPFSTGYEFVTGSPEDIQDLPVFGWGDVSSWLLAGSSERAQGTQAAPVRLLRRDMPKKVYDLLHELYGAAKGQRIGKYKSRSEAEAGVVTMLVLAGWGFENVQSLFSEWQPGHYAETKEKYKGGYLRRTFGRVLGELAANPTRQAIAAYYGEIEQALEIPILKRHVLLGLLAIGWQLATWQPRAAQRDLSLYADCSRGGVVKALDWLEVGGWIESGKPGTCRSGTEFEIKNNKRQKESISHIKDTSLQRLGTEGAAKARNALAVYALLGGEALGLPALADLSGYSSRMLQDALHLLEGYGLAKRVQLSKAKQGPGRNPLGWVVDAELQDPQENAHRRESIDQERESWQTYHHEATPDCTGACLPSDAWILPGKKRLNRSCCGYEPDLVDIPPNRGEKRSDPAARFDTSMQGGGAEAVGYVAVMARPEAVTYKQAEDPHFCADCGGSDFWRLNSGRFVCGKCRPKPGGYHVQGRRSVGMTEQEETARRAYLVQQGRALIAAARAEKEVKL